MIKSFILFVGLLFGSANEQVERSLTFVETISIGDDTNEIKQCRFQLDAVKEDKKWEGLLSCAAEKHSVIIAMFGELGNMADTVYIDETTTYSIMIDAMALPNKYKATITIEEMSETNK